MINFVVKTINCPIIDLLVKRHYFADFELNSIEFEREIAGNFGG
jgi:hypothetical protein